MEHMLKRLAGLMSVKSLVTITLTAIFAVQAIRGAIGQEFMTIYAVIISFYFGTQHEKTRKEGAE